MKGIAEIQEILIRLEIIETLLRSVQMANKDIMNIEEAANYCGVKKSFLYKLCSERKIPHYKNSGKMLRFKKRELEVWLLRNRVKSSDELDQESNSYIIKSSL